MLLYNIIYLVPHTRHACVVDISFRNVHVYSVGTPLNIYIYILTHPLIITAVRSFCCVYILRGAILNKAYGTHKHLYNHMWSYLLWSPAIVQTTNKRLDNPQSEAVCICFYDSDHSLFLSLQTLEKWYNNYIWRVGARCIPHTPNMLFYDPSLTIP